MPLLITVGAAKMINHVTDLPRMNFVIRTGWYELTAHSALSASEAGVVTILRLFQVNHLLLLHAKGRVAEIVTPGQGRESNKIKSLTLFLGTGFTISLSLKEMNGVTV